MYLVNYEYKFREENNCPAEEPAPLGVFTEKVIAEIDYNCNRMHDALFVAKEDFISNNGPHLSFELEYFVIKDVTAIQV